MAVYSNQNVLVKNKMTIMKKKKTFFFITILMFLLTSIVMAAENIEEQGHEVAPGSQVLESQQQEMKHPEAKVSLERKPYLFLTNQSLSNRSTNNQTKQTSNNTDPLNVSLGLIFILVLIFSLAWFMKKMGYSNLSKQGQLKIVASLNLGPKEKIALIQVGDQQLLVGMTSTQINTLHVLDESLHEEKNDDAALKNGTMNKNSFANKLSEFITNKT